MGEEISRGGNEFSREASNTRKIYSVGGIISVALRQPRTLILSPIGIASEPVEGLLSTRPPTLVFTPRRALGRPLFAGSPLSAETNNGTALDATQVEKEGENTAAIIEQGKE